MTPAQPMPLRPHTEAPANLLALCEAVGQLAAAGPPPRRVRLQIGDASVEVEWPDGAVAVGLPPADAVVAEEIPAELAVRAPLVGTFYRCSEPGAPPFVEVGMHVSPGQQVGIVEAMKLMNPVEAEAEGVVREILVENGQGVEFGQPLIVLAPPEVA